MAANRIKLSYPIVEDRKSRRFFTNVEKIGESCLSSVVAATNEEDYDDLVWLYDTSTIETRISKRTKSIRTAALRLYLPKHMGLSVIYVSSSRNLGTAYKNILSDTQKLRGDPKKNKAVRSQEGLETYLSNEYPVPNLTFADIDEAEIEQQEGRYVKGVVLKLANKPDKQSEQEQQDEQEGDYPNKTFFAAQELCVKALGKYRGQDTVSSHTTLRIGEVDMTHKGPEELAGFFEMVRKILPITLNVGRIKPEYVQRPGP